MLTIFWHSLCRRFRKDRPICLMLLLGVFVGVLCISLVLGYAYGQYQQTTGYSFYASLTVVPDESMRSSLDTLPDQLEELYPDKLANVLYLTDLGDDSILIGWQGTSGDRWFPITGGRFFSEHEMDTGAPAAVVSDTLYRSLQGNAIEIAGTSYPVIGSGWISNFNFQSAISQAASVQPYPAEQGTDKTHYIIPYSCYFNENTPDLILIHFDTATTSVLQEYSQRLKSIYPNAEVFCPDRSSDVEWETYQVSGSVLAILLGFVACITIIQLEKQWAAFYQKELRVYHLCGLSAHRCGLILMGHWAVIFAASSILAIMVHLISFPLLEMIEVNYPPAVMPMLLVLALLYLVTAGISYFEIKRYLSNQKKGDVI